jgi:hypothetical protein
MISVAASSTDNYVFWEKLSISNPSLFLPSMDIQAVATRDGNIAVYSGYDPNLINPFVQLNLMKLMINDTTITPYWKICDSSSLIKPLPRSGVAMVYSDIRDELYAFGGAYADGSRNYLFTSGMYVRIV